jgi:2-dehydro-3-deoxygluconokinase
MSRLVCFGEVLLRLNCPNNMRFSQALNYEAGYVGSETNVAVLAARLGVPTSVVTALPNNDLGDTALSQIRQQGIDTSFIKQFSGRLGVFFTEAAASIRPGNIIYDRENSCFANLKPGMINWNEVFKGASWFHWSGISAGVSNSAAEVCLEAVKAAKNAGLIISADFNYRSKLWNYGKHPSQVMPELLAYCDVIYGDIDTADIYFGIKTDKALPRNKALLACGEELKKRLPNTKCLAMTFREQQNGSQRYSGVILSDKLYESQSYELGNIVERIGTGDSFMGALVFALAQGYNHQEAIEFAVAAGALKHSVVGDLGLLSKSEIESLIKSGSTFGRVNR